MTHIARVFQLSLLCTALLVAHAQAPKKPIVYIPFAQSEFAYNLIKECPAIEVTWILEGSDFAVSWGVNERENRNDWVVYTSKDGHVTGSG